MIELKDLRKSYKTGDFEQRALDGVSIAYRENEFVAVLGPSGSGKTTLLNILGGLDHADSGEIIINGVSTKNYKDADWDTYRNHHIGFIFQSYNLIPHQTVLSNVELALTLAGVGPEERKRRAKEALEVVGLGDHVDKIPNQLSGGQAQRVAIARALVNNPDIVLADEPTGALDTETGVQVMDLLQEIAQDRLVIMVTHNPELAERYANRIVSLTDGRITSDTNPVTDEELRAAKAAHRAAKRAAASGAPAAAAAAAGAGAEVADSELAPDAAVDNSTADTAATSTTASSSSSGKEGKASMSFLTALSLSFSNLMTKKGRTLLTAFAGSIGIIGIAAILALSNGVNEYIAKVEEDTLSSYPLTIQKSTFDMTSMMTGSSDDTASTTKTTIESGNTKTVIMSENIPQRMMVRDMFAQIGTNDLKSFRSYLESDESGIYKYVNAIQYNYGTELCVYKPDTSNGVVQLNPATIMSAMGMNASMYSSTSLSLDTFNEMIDDRKLLESQYDVVAGKWPEAYDECVLVVSENGKVLDYTLYNIGVLDTQELDDMAAQAMKQEKVDVVANDVKFTYEDALNLRFKVVNSCDLYKHNAEFDVWSDMQDDEEFMKTAVANGLDLKVVGVVKGNGETNSSALKPGIAYTPALTKYLIEQAGESEIVKQQLANPDVDVFSGETFEDLKEKNKSGIDMDKMFSIDEAALANAFKFDTSAIGTGSSDMDMSGLDIGSMMKGMPQPKFEKITIDADMVNMAINAGVAQSTLNQSLADMTNALYNDWSSSGSSKTFDKYVSDGDGDAIINSYSGTIASAFATEASAQAMKGMLAMQLKPIIDEWSKEMTVFMGKVAQEMATQMGMGMAASMERSMSSLENAFKVDTNAFSSAFKFNLSQEDLAAMMSSYASASGSADADTNLRKIGYSALDNPNEIKIYPIDFEAKDAVKQVIETYNDKMKKDDQEEKVISYTDIMGVLMSSVTDIVNMISTVLIAFVAISLVVSSIMIGIITYISVLERKKEIGILRAMGASKRNVANIFNAETIIEGFIAGVFAIAVVVLVSIPVNIVVQQVFNVQHIMSLPIAAGVILILISVALTYVAGLIPSSAASKRDPVEALRSE